MIQVTTTEEVYDNKSLKWVEIEVPCYKHASLDKEYIKQLLFVESHPNTPKKPVLLGLYGKIKNFGTFDDLVMKGMVKQVGTGKYKAALYSITSKGYALLFNVIGAPDWAYNDIEEMKRLADGYTTLEEFDINSSLAGVHPKFEHFTSREFIESLRKVDFAGKPDFTRIFRRFLALHLPFYTQILDRLGISDN